MQVRSWVDRGRATKSPLVPRRTSRAIDPGRDLRGPLGRLANAAKAAFERRATRQILCTGRSRTLTSAAVARVTQTTWTLPIRETWKEQHAPRRGRPT